MSISNSAELILPRVKLTTTNNDNHIYIDTEVRIKKPEMCVDIARNAFKSGKTRNYTFRLEQLKSLKRMIEENGDKMREVLYQDLHKCKTESNIFELELILFEINQVIKHFNRWLKPRSQSRYLMNFFDKVEIRKDPYGVVLIISPWNYPFFTSLKPFVGALAGGNCVILKLSEISVASSRLLYEMLPNYLDKDCYQVMLGGPAETTALLQNKFDYIFFTGSSKIGKIVHHTASKHLTPCTLELGGKNPVYLDDTVDLYKATQRIMFGKFSNAGQTCIAPDYLLCSKEIEIKFLDCVRRIIREWFGDDPQLSPCFGRIINETHFKRLVSYLDSNNIAIGGKYVKEDRYMEPTILTDVSINNPVMQDEIFGPILPIINMDSIYAAVDYVNNNEKPLVLYVFSRNKKTIDFLLDNTSTGAVNINDTLTHVACPSLPFGGVGNSGMGAIGRKYTVDTFTHEKSVLKKNYCPIGNIFQRNLYPPFNDRKEFVIKFLIRRGIPLPSLKMIFVVIILLVLIALLIYAFASR